MKVLSIGTDLTSRGGIASVVKTFYKISLDYDVEYAFLKTTNYKHSSKLSNLLIFINAMIKFLVIANKFDIIHMQGSSHGSFYRKAVFLSVAKLFGKKVIWNFHASRFDDFFLENSGLKKSTIERFLNCADLILVLSEELKNKLQTEYPKSKVSVLRNPVELQKKLPTNSPNENGVVNFLFLGFFIKNKGVQDLLDVAATCSQKNYRFKFAGKGELQAQIDKAADLEKSNVVNLGWLEEQEKAQAIADCDVLILPSYREGMPIVILEAMIQGKPIVSTNIAAIPELIRNGYEGYLYSPGDKSGLKESIDLMADAYTREKFGARCLEKVKHYYPSAVFKDLVNIYKEVLR